MSQMVLGMQPCALVQLPPQGTSDQGWDLWNMSQKDIQVGK